MSDSYSPGLHLLGQLHTDQTELLRTAAGFRAVIDAAIAEAELTSVGEVYHDFPGGGFTAVICLTESHLSIHTWPEYGRATLDVFLSNFRQVNDHKAQLLFERCRAYFQATTHHYHELKR